MKILCAEEKNEAVSDSYSTKERSLSSFQRTRATSSKCGLTADLGWSCHTVAQLTVSSLSIRNSIRLLEEVLMALAKSRIPNALLLSQNVNQTSKQAFERLVDVNNLVANPTANLRILLVSHGTRRSH